MENPNIDGPVGLKAWFLVLIVIAIGCFAHIHQQNKEIEELKRTVNQREVVIDEFYEEIY